MLLFPGIKKDLRLQKTVFVVSFIKIFPFLFSLNFTKSFDNIWLQLFSEIIHKIVWFETKIRKIGAHVITRKYKQLTVTIFCKNNAF